MAFRHSNSQTSSTTHKAILGLSIACIQQRYTTTRPFLSWTVNSKPMKERNCSCLVKTRFVSGGGAKPAG